MFNISPMNILLLFNHGKIVGGGELSFLRYANHLAHMRDVNLTIFVPKDGNLPEFLKIDQDKIISFDLPSLRRRPYEAKSAIMNLHRMFRALRPDVAHANGSRVALFSNMAKLNTKTKVIWHVRIAKRDIIDPILMLSEGIIANSNKTKNERFPAGTRKMKKIRVIYNGFEIDEMREKLERKEKKKAKDTSVTLSSASRLETGKGLEYMLAFAEILSWREDIRVLVAGKGPMEKTLKGIPKNLRANFPGYMPVEDILCSSDIICFPSLVDSFGNLVVESMIAGKPCMVSRFSGASEIYPVKELVFDPKSFCEFERSFHLARNRIEDQSTVQLLISSSERFSIKRHVQEVLEFYDQIISDHQRSIRNLLIARLP